MFGLRTFLIFQLCLIPSVLAAVRSPCSIQRAATTETHVWLLCDRNDLFASPDGGATWQMRRIPAEGKFRAIAFLDSRRGFLTGNAGALFGTEDGAETWRRIAVPAEENLTAIQFVGQSGWITGWNGLILHSKDAGRTWVQQASGVRQALEDVFFADAERGWAVGWVGTALRTGDGGQTWEQMRIPSTLWSLNSVYFRDKDRGWIVGFGGLILTTRDGGQTWAPRESPLQASLSSVRVDAAGRGWIAADNDLLISADGGDSWKRVTLEGTLFLKQVLSVRDSLWAVGQFGVLRQDGGGDGFARLGTLPGAGSGAGPS